MCISVNLGYFCFFFFFESFIEAQTIVKRGDDFLGWVENTEQWVVSFPAAFLFFHFLCFPFIFSVAKHPLRMTTQGMIG